MELKKNIYVLAATGWTILITVLSLFPFSEANNIKSPVLDKVVHVAFYLVFTLLWYIALKSRKPEYLIPKIFFISIIYGIIIEVLQDMMPFNRHLDIKDVLANILGAFIGITITKIYLMSSGIALKRKK